MIIFLTATSTILLFSIVIFGWGRLAVTYLYKEPSQSIAFEISVGLAIWVFWGGWLNALSLAYPFALNIIFGMGGVFWGVYFFNFIKEKKLSIKNYSFVKFVYSQKKIQISKTLLEAIPLLLLISATVFLIFTLLPSNAFNHHDDYYTYFPRLFRMLQTGKLGDALSYDFIGFDSLGAHQFLQSFLLNHFPVGYINGFDAVFCFLIGGLLLNDIGRWSGQHWLIRCAALAAYIIINPQYVNTSALYSGSLMILALLYASLLLYASFKKQEAKEMFWAAMIFSLIASALVALKHTFVPFTVLYCIFFFLLLFSAINKQRRNIFLISGISAAMTGVMLFPWLWTVYDKIMFFINVNIIKLKEILAQTSLISEALAKTNQEILSHGNLEIKFSVLRDLFSTNKLFYGGNASDYSFIVLCTLVAAVWAVYLIIKKKESSHQGNLLVVISVGISLPVAYLISAYFADNFEVGIRYLCPFFITTFPGIALLLAGSSKFKYNGFISKKMYAKQSVIFLILIICIGLFLTNYYGRLNKILIFRSMLSYPLNENYITYQEKILSKNEQKTVLSMQEITEKKAGILAWFDSSFFLNFQRNRVFSIAGPSFISFSSGLSVKDFATVEKLENYLQSVGIRYVIWGYKGFAKQKNLGSQELEQGIRALIHKGYVIYNDGKKLIIDIKS